MYLNYSYAITGLSVLFTSNHTSSELCSLVSGFTKKACLQQFAHHVCLVHSCYIVVVTCSLSLRASSEQPLPVNQLTNQPANQITTLQKQTNTPPLPNKQRRD